MPNIPLDQEWDFVPAVADSADPTPLETTTLPNGLRVASMDVKAPFASVGVFIDAGSRYENAHNNGISHFLEHMAFNSTESRSDFKLVRDMLSDGSSVACAAHREHTIFSGECLQEQAPQMVSSLADVIQNSLFTELETRDARARYRDELKDLEAQEQVSIMEAVHAAGYFNNTVGLSLYAPTENLDFFNSESLRDHVHKTFTPQRMVVGAVGIAHADLVAMVGEQFNALNASGRAVADEQKAVYTGGDVRHDRRGDASDGLTHVALAFESASWHSQDLVPACVLQMMMGGGGSFSAGGPGKGMYSRLYENVLNQHGWVESATCFNSIFNDTSLFGIYGTTLPQNSPELVDVLSKEFIKMSQGVNAEELSRAKNQLKSAVHMQLEGRVQKLEDLGRQLLTYDKVQSPQEISAQIDAVTAEDIKRVATAMLKTPVSIAACGNTSFLPNYDSVKGNFQ